MYDWFSYDNTSALYVNNTYGLLEVYGDATAQEYMDFLSTVRYHNTLDEPNRMYQERLIYVIIREDNQYFKGRIKVVLIPVNDPAQFNFFNRTIVFDEATRDPVPLFENDDTISDPDQDGGNLTYVTLTLWPIVHEGDTLSINSTSIQPLVSSNRTHINISGVAPIEDYKSILENVTFVNRRVDSPPVTRQIIVNTFDGYNSSMGPVIHVSINTTDDPPVCFFGGNVVSDMVTM